MKWHKILICSAVLIIMHYVDFFLFDKEFPLALPITAAAGAVCGAFCGENKFLHTARNSALTLILYVALIFLTGKLSLYEMIMFPCGMTEENYMSASNRGAAGLLIMLLFGVTSVWLIIGSAVSWGMKSEKGGEDQR